MTKSKDKHKESGKNRKKNKASKITPGDQVTPVDVAGRTVYADGVPFDRVQYLEAKLILKPDNFTSVQAFRDFGKIIERTAKKVGVGFMEDARPAYVPRCARSSSSTLRIFVSTRTPSFCEDAYLTSTASP